MSALFQEIAADTATLMQAGYILGCILLALITFLAPKFRRTKKRALETPMGHAHSTELAPHHHHVLQVRWMRVLEGPGSGALLHLIVILGTATCALIGWRIPAEIERIYGAGARFGLIFPNVDMPMIGRLAQVVGAAIFGAVALRMLRLIVPIMSLLLIVLLGFLAVDYVFNLPGLGLF